MPSAEDGMAVSPLERLTVRAVKVNQTTGSRSEKSALL
jgi:hypothetical protein